MRTDFKGPLEESVKTKSAKFFAHYEPIIASSKELFFLFLILMFEHFWPSAGIGDHRRKLKAI